MSQENSLPAAPAATALAARFKRPRDAQTVPYPLPSQRTPISSSSKGPSDPFHSAVTTGLPNPIESYSCPICHKSFSRENDVGRHVWTKLHYGEVSQNEHLRTRYARWKPLICEICGKPFRRDELKVHQNRLGHHGPAPTAPAQPARRGIDSPPRQPDIFAEYSTGGVSLSQGAAPPRSPGVLSLGPSVQRDVAAIAAPPFSGEPAMSDLYARIPREESLGAASSESRPRVPAEPQSTPPLVTFQLSRGWRVVPETYREIPLHPSLGAGPPRRVMVDVIIEEIPPSPVSEVVVSATATALQPPVPAPSSSSLSSSSASFQPQDVPVPVQRADDVFAFPGANSYTDFSFMLPHHDGGVPAWELAQVYPPPSPPSSLPPPVVDLDPFRQGTTSVGASGASDTPVSQHPRPPEVDGPIQPAEDVFPSANLCTSSAVIPSHNNDGGPSWESSQVYDNPVPSWWHGYGDSNIEASSSMHAQWYNNGVSSWEPHGYNNGSSFSEQAPVYNSHGTPPWEQTHR